MVEYRMSLGEEESAELYNISEALNQAIYEKTKVWIQPSTQQAVPNDDTVRDGDAANLPSVSLDPRE